MRLGFKHFNIGKREFCITAYRFLETYNGAIDTFRFNLLPIIRYEYSRSTKELYLGWLFWMVVIEDETYVNMGCIL